MSFKKERFCVTCRDTNSFELKLCSKCKLLRYCSRSCQKIDYNSHKTRCLEAFLLKTKIEALKEQRPPSEDSLPLRKCLINMAEAVWRFASKYSSYELAEMYLEDYLCEILFWDELAPTPSNYLCELRIPFVMILLDKDNDAIIFIHKWLFHDRKELTMNAFYKSWLGEFVHDKPYDIDFLTYLSGKNYDFLYDAPIAYVAAMLVIKLKRVHEYDDQLEKHNEWKKKLGQANEESITGQLRNCPDVMASIDLFTLGDPKIHETNKWHLDGLMKVVNARNRFFIGVLSSDDLGYHWSAEQELWSNTFAPDRQIIIIMTTFLTKVADRLPGQARKRIHDFAQRDLQEIIKNHYAMK